MVHIIGPQVPSAPPIRGARTHRRGYSTGPAVRLPVCQDSLASLQFAPAPQQPAFFSGSLQNLNDGISVAPACCNLLQPSAAEQDPCQPCISLATDQQPNHHHSTFNGAASRDKVHVRGVAVPGTHPSASNLLAVVSVQPTSTGSDNPHLSQPLDSGHELHSHSTPTIPTPPSAYKQHTVEQPAAAILPAAAPAVHTHTTLLHQTSGAAIAAAMNKCHSLAQLSELHSRTGDSWDSTHVVAALCKAAKASELMHCSQPEPPAWSATLLTTLLTSAEAACQTNKPTLRQLVNLLWVVAKLQLWTSPAGLGLLNTLSGRLQSRLSQSLKQQAGHTGLPGSPITDAEKQRCAVPGAASTHRAKQLKPPRRPEAVSPQDVSNSVWALVRLSVPLDVSASTSLHNHPTSLDEPSQSDDQVSPSAADLPEPLKERLSQLWPLLLEHVPMCVQDMDAQNVSNTLWSLAHVSTPTTRVEHTPGTRAYAYQQQQALCQQTVEVLSDRAVQVAGHMDRQHVANVAWACACLQHRNDVLLAALAGRVRVQLRNLTAQGLSMTAWAFGRLGYRCPDLAHDLTRAATWKIRKFRMQGLSNLVWGLHVVSHGRIPHPFLGLVARETLYKLEEALPLGLTTLVTAWASAGYYKQDLYTAVLSRARQLLPAFLPHTLIKLLTALHHMRHVDLAFLSEAARQLQAAALHPAQPAVVHDQLGSEGQQQQHHHHHTQQLSHMLTSSSSSSSSSPPHAVLQAPAAAGSVLSASDAVALARIYGQVSLQPMHSAASLLTALAPHLHAALDSQALCSNDQVHLAVAYAQAGLCISPSEPTQQSDAQRFLQALSHRLEAVQPVLTVPQLSAAAWALATVGSPAGTRLAAACITSAAGSQVHARQLLQETSGRWRARLAAVLMQQVVNTAAESATAQPQVLESQGPRAAGEQARAAAYAHKLVTSVQDELQSLDAPSLLHALQVLHTVGDVASHVTRQTAAEEGQLVPGQAARAGPPAVSNHFKLVQQELSDRCDSLPAWEALALCLPLPSNLQLLLSPFISHQANRLVHLALQLSQPCDETTRLHGSGSTWQAGRQGVLQAGSGGAGAHRLRWCAAVEALPASVQLVVLVHGWSALAALGRADARASRVLRDAVLGLVSCLPPARDMLPGEAADVGGALAAAVQLDASLRQALPRVQQAAVRAARDKHVGRGSHVASLKHAHSAGQQEPDQSRRQARATHAAKLVIGPVAQSDDCQPVQDTLWHAPADGTQNLMVDLHLRSKPSRAAGP